jgi:hypothetical protein
MSALRLSLLSTLLLVVLGAYLYLRHREAAPEPSVSRSDLPAGRWRLVAPKKTSTPAGEGLARTISLPYLSGSKAPPAGSGVTIWDRRRAFPGVNLYTSGHAPQAYLIDMAGRTLHRWRYPFERAFPGKAPTEETAFFRRAQLAPDGTLLAIYQGGGLVALDRASRLLWKVDAGTYNDFFRAEDGTIYLLTKEAKILPEVSTTQPTLEDSITIVDPQGNIRERISLLRALLDSPFAPLFSPHAAAGDVLHANTIEIFDGRLAARSPRPGLFARGNALVSLREIDTIGIVDLKSRRFVWAQRGPWAGQHQPTLLESGKILLFDNQPHRRLSYVEEIDLDGRVGWRYPRAGQFLSSEQAGTAERLPNGNTLITESDRGRALEVTPAGETVWEFLSPHRAGPKGAFVATLFEMVRLPEGPAGR